MDHHGTRRRWDDAVVSTVSTMDTSTDLLTPVPTAPVRAYTLRLDAVDAARIDALVVRMRAQTGRPVRTSDVLRALVGLADAHDGVRALVVDRLRTR